MKTRLLAATVVALIPLAGFAAEGTKTPDPATPAGQTGSFDTRPNTAAAARAPIRSVEPR
jgi:hypothetical protein